MLALMLTSNVTKKFAIGDTFSCLCFPSLFSDCDDRSPRVESLSWEESPRLFDSATLPAFLVWRDANHGPEKTCCLKKTGIEEGIRVFKA